MPVLVTGIAVICEPITVVVTFLKGLQMGHRAWSD